MSCDIKQKPAGIGNHRGSLPRSMAHFYHLFDQAENVRWKLIDLPWDEFDAKQVTDELIQIVRQIASSELTTWSASKMFLDEFQGDVDFTQWISVWMYEEAKHPYVLLKWLAVAGESFAESFVETGRAAQPFMRSRVGTLTMNILSEIEASSIYMGISRHVGEPMLKRITRLLASDEARHASSFYIYARALLNKESDRRAIRIEILKVLYFWLVSMRSVQHPVAIVSQLIAKSQCNSGNASTLMNRSLVEARMRAVVGTLVGERLDDAEAVMDRIKVLSLSTQER